MPVSPSQFPALATGAVAKVMFDQYAETPALFPLITTPVAEQDLYSPFGHKQVGATGFGEPPEREDGQEFESADIAEGYTRLMKIRLLSQKVSIPYRLMEQFEAQGLEAHIRTQTGGWGRAFKSRKERMVAAVFNKGRLNAGDTSVFNQSFQGETDSNPAVIYDGESFIGAAHPNKVGGSYSNAIDSTALSSTSFDAAKVRLEATNALDERGLQVSITANTLLVPKALEGVARRVVLSQQLAGTAQNDVNPYLNSVRVLAWPYLTDTDGWFLGSAGVGAGSQGIMTYDDGLPAIRVVDNPSKACWDILAESRFGYAVADWRAWVGANLSAS